ncbi:glutamate-5-semialdehyde dehydrogenase [Kiritimatiella glycovorans]|uniref:Gamma-glutamyl phosphate reductase n=1 Tax=Kiritimatiella glycovorans TaxID=1307763 RepID=A0A0G3EKB5_9BACT|nr:glutamate-5-semialdehyde dehydrogenase [Kiritimatiella glycovorans]AKJ65260.1 Gamma-glutamyl phosphate reductase [Kiritimatiella glycovorans]
MSLHEEIRAVGDAAVAASRQLAKLTARRKNVILEAMADELANRREEIAEANRRDLDEGKERQLSSAMLDRLELTDKRFDGMVNGLTNVAALKDPVGSKISRWIRPNGLEIRKIRVPIGVIGIIYESRPNVTADAAGLCIKTSNAVVLRGGKESIHSNRAIAAALQEGGQKKGLPPGAVQLIQTTDRDAVRELVQLDDCLDLVIPRGGEALIRAVTEMARVPVIKHYKGICHTYVDAEADPEMALSICENAKCQRPGVCNAMETLLVHKDLAPTFLPRIAERMQARGVELRGDETACGILSDIAAASEEDWSEEYLDMILSVAVVDDVEAAVAHINRYGSSHSDAIITNSDAARKTFLAEVDSSTVYVNASTRFTDGGEFGMGAEIGISTDKLHARGPMGLEELTTYKYVITGKGQIRE